MELCIHPYPLSSRLLETNDCRRTVAVIEIVDLDRVATIPHELREVGSLVHVETIERENDLVTVRIILHVTPHFCTLLLPKNAVNTLIQPLLKVKKTALSSRA